MLSRRLAALAATLLLGSSSALAQPAPLKGLSLTDHRQQTVDAAALAGRPTLLHFVYTTCSTSCPLQVRELVQVHQALPDEVRARVRFLSVTVDPLQDTPATMAAFARRFEADRAGWLFATGEAKQVHTLVERMQALDARDPRPESHRTSLYLYDARGTLLKRYAGTPVDRPRLVAEITQVARMK